MIDQAGIIMAQGKSIACERIQGINDNMGKSHYHDYFELYYLETGKRYHMIDDQLYKINPGELLIFSPYVMHHSYGEKDMPFKRLLVYFHPDEIDSPKLLKALTEGTGVYKPEPKTGQIIYTMLRQLLNEQETPSVYDMEYMHSLLNLLLLTVIRDVHTPVKTEKTNRINEVIQYIHKNYHQDINLDQLAQNFYISPYYLCREFKRYTNSTIIQYVNITRIMNAQRKMMETDCNITEISRATGFSNITHFNRVFKKIAGMTPSQYRKLHKNGKDKSSLDQSLDF